MPDTRSPEEIERDIERERQELTGTIGTLQDRFSLDGVAQQVSDHLKDNGGEIARNISATVKQNPLGVALVGAGLAWLALGNGVGTRKSDERRSDAYDAPKYEPHGRGHELDRANADPAPAPAQATAFSSVRDDDPDMDWYYDDLDDDDRGITDSLRDHASAASDSVSSAASSAKRGLNGAARSVADGASAAGASAKGAAQSASSAIGGAAASAGNAVSSAAASLSDTAASAAERARLTAAQTRARLAQGTEGLGEEARDRVVRARNAALKARDSAASTARAAADASSDAYERQPLAFGALAFAIGAAAAATLPSTRREDEALGAQSDRLMRRAQRVFEEEKARAEELAKTVKDEATQAVKDAKQDLDDRAPGDKTAVEAAIDKVEHSAKRVASKAQDEARKKEFGASLQD